MKGEEIRAFLGKDWTRVQELIRSALSSDIRLLNRVNREVLSRSGKQLRPMVSLLMAMACSQDGHVTESSLRYAAAAELLHNATIMHDDVADGSKTRRGAPTVSARIGERAAVLLGDFWLSRAVSEVMDASHHDNVARLFSKTLSDLSEGEMLQLQKSEDADTCEEDYYRIIYCKTVSLFEAASVSGAISVDATLERQEAAARYAGALGTAFQIKDDILDYQGGESLGKPMGVDIREGKITLPLLGAFRNAPSSERKIRKKLAGGGLSADDCERITAYVKDNGGVEYASSCLDRYILEAESALDIFEDSPQKDYLVQIAAFNAYRKV